MTSVTIIVISDLVTLVLTLAVTLISIGIKWGKITSDISVMKESISEIKGMFVLRLRDGSHGD